MKFRGPQALNDTLVDRFHIMIVILIEPTQLLWFLATLHLPAHVTVLGTVARLDRQTPVKAAVIDTVGIGRKPRCSSLD